MDIDPLSPIPSDDAVSSTNSDESSDYSVDTESVSHTPSDHSADTEPVSPTSSDGSMDLDDALLNICALTVTTMMQAAESEEEADAQRSPQRRLYLQRRREEAYARLVRFYFAEQPIFGAIDFRRRYRMSKNLFLRITTDLEETYRYFQQKMDATGKMGFAPIHKTTAALRLLAYGSSVDSFDENLEMSARTCRETLRHFCKGIIELYGSTYLRRPTKMDLERLYAVHDDIHGFPGMIGSIDCMHWTWELCPTAWRGSHTRGDIGKPSLMLQAVASTDLWIWNAYFGQQGSNNDINVFESSPVLEEIISGLAPTLGFYAVDNYYNAGYYLTDGIYPEYSMFVKTFTDPLDDKRKYFKKKQESARKDIERAFGVLKKRWRIINFPARFMTKERMHDVIYACIILHNMILQDEGKAYCQDFNSEDPTLDPEYWEQETPMETRVQNSQAVRNSQTHNMLLADLVDHLWENKTHHQEVPTPDIDDYVSDPE